jgi:UBX domain-containing protein 1
VARRTNEDYVQPPKRPLAAFEGGGQRLGSPVPAIAGAAAQSQTVPGAFPDSGAASPAPRSMEPRGGRFEVDFNEPTTSVQVRLADGTR